MPSPTPSHSNDLQSILWWQTAADNPTWPVLEQDIDVDIAIVGAGFTGLTAALHLVEAGIRVAVLEAAVPGAGASGRCAGFVVPNLARADPAHIGEPLARLIGTAGNKVFATAERLGAAHCIDRCGWIQPVVGQLALPAAQTRFAQWQELGQPVEWLNATEAEQTTGIKNLSGAWIDHSGGTMQPVDYLHALAQRIQQQQGLLYAHSPVKKLSDKSGSWCLTTDKANVYAKKILVCTNGTRVAGLPLLSQSVLPVTVHQIATRPLSEKQRAELTISTGPVSDTRSNIFTYRFDQAGRLITGGIAGLPIAARQRMKKALLKRLHKELALPDGLAVETIWSGRIAITADYLPHLHQPVEGVWVGIGCNGRGIAMTAVLGEIMAQAVLDETAKTMLPVTPLRVMRWRRVAPYLVGSHLLIGRLRDRFNP